MKNAYRFLFFSLALIYLIFGVISAAIAAVEYFRQIEHWMYYIYGALLFGSPLLCSFLFFMLAWRYRKSDFLQVDFADAASIDQEHALTPFGSSSAALLESRPEVSSESSLIAEPLQFKLVARDFLMTQAFLTRGREPFFYFLTKWAIFIYLFLIFINVFSWLDLLADEGNPLVATLAIITVWSVLLIQFLSGILSARAIKKSYSNSGYEGEYAMQFYSDGILQIGPAMRTFYPYTCIESLVQTQDLLILSLGHLIGIPVNMADLDASQKQALLQFMERRVQIARADARLSVVAGDSCE